MTYSALTNQVRLSNQSSSRQGAKIDTFLIHHQAGTNDDAVINAMVSGSRQVSANYTISNEGRITSVVPEELRAWTSGSTSDGGKGAAWDRRSITVEIENQSAGGSWPISGAAKTAAANLLNDLRARYGALTVLGHRDLYQQHGASYATFCPGPNTVAEILAIAGGGSAAADTPAASSGVSEHIRNVQKRLIELGYDLGSWGADGLKGAFTDAAIKAFQRANGLDDDGLPGDLTNAKLWPSSSTPGVAAPAFPLRAGWYFGPQSGPVHSVSGYHGNREDLRRWQERMRDRGWAITTDGLYGDQTAGVAESFQREKGLTVDRLIGAQTWAAAWTEPVT
jgi:N-acetyl-anhydromuramyl-L-alanine amidase AmpD